MKKLYFNKIIVCVFILFAIGGCDILSEPDQDFKLKGTWIDKDSYALSYIDFYSQNQGSFCLLNKNVEIRDTFNYEYFNDSIAISYLHDADSVQYLHRLTFTDDNTLKISNMTVIPENPDKTYYRKNIISTKQNDTITIGLKDLFYDKNLDFRIEIDSVLNDSRCPNGAECVWAGNAEVRLDLIMEGNYHYKVNLNTLSSFRQDTLIRGINYHLADLLPYPDISKTLNYQDYKVKLIATKK